MEEALTYTVKKRKSTRIAYRVVGICFAALGLFFIWCLFFFNNGMGRRFLFAAFGLALFMYGFMLVKSSFRKSAFDLTYIFGEDFLTIKNTKKEKSWEIPYEKLSNVNLVIPDHEMAYYVLKIDIGREQFVLPFMGGRTKCDAIYTFLLKKMGMLDVAEEKEE